MNLFDDYGLTRLINLKGPATVIGGCRVSPQVIKYMESVLSEAVDMRQLQALASEIISYHTGAEGGCVTGCAAAGIAISIAAFLTGDNLGKIINLPRSINGRNRILIQKTQMVDAGGCSIEQLVRLSGASITEVGDVADCAPFHLESAIDQNVAGALFVLGQRANVPGTLPLNKFISICHKNGIPVAIDAAAITISDIRHYIEMSADLVIVSSQKWLGGPTAGLIAGRADLIHACYLNGEFGIGRPMKAGKENIAGLIGALETGSERNNTEEKKNQEYTIIMGLAKSLEGEPGITVRVDEHNRLSPAACVLNLTFEPQIAGLSAGDFAERLLTGNPRIAVYDFCTPEEVVTIDPIYMRAEELETVTSRIKETLANARSNPIPDFYEEVKPRFEVLVSHMINWRDEHPVYKKT